ncbi:MAG: M48 family metalloprotease [Phycisphaerae bacterium]
MDSWGQLAFERQHGGRVDDPAVAGIERVVAKLIGDAWDGPDIRVGILGTNDRNAYVLASGHVYVTVGMLDILCTVDELAAVLAHELAHLEYAGDFESQGRDLDERLQVESDADCRAVARLIDAGYEPAMLAEMVEKLADEQPEGWAGFRRRRLAERLGEPDDRDYRIP